MSTAFKTKDSPKSRSPYMGIESVDVSMEGLHGCKNAKIKPSVEVRIFATKRGPEDYRGSASTDYMCLVGGEV